MSSSKGLDVTCPLGRELSGQKTTREEGKDPGAISGAAAVACGDEHEIRTRCFILTLFKPWLP